MILARLTGAMKPFASLLAITGMVSRSRPGTEKSGPRVPATSQKCIGGRRQLRCWR